MTKVDAWKCDLCQKVFNNIEHPKKDHVDGHIMISSANEYDEGIAITFEHLCIPCRNELFYSIKTVLNKYDV